MNWVFAASPPRFTVEGWPAQTLDADVDVSVICGRTVIGVTGKLNVLMHPLSAV